MKLPEEFIELVRQYSGAEDSAKMNTSRIMSDFWVEYGGAIINDMGDEGKAHKWYIESVAASVGMSPSSMYNRKRVGDNIVQRGLDDAEPQLSFGQWLALLRNADTDENGLVPDDELYNRLEWVHSETDRYGGQVPSVRDIEKHFKKNGKHKEWQLYWKAIVRNAKKILDLNDRETEKMVTLIAVDVVELEEKYEQERRKS